MSSPESSSLFHASKVKQRREHLPFDVENWYDWLGAEHTFATRFVEISVGEAQALLRWYHHRYNGRAAPTADEVGTLTALRGRLDDVLAEPATDWFIRLSSRSPKDAGTLDKEKYEAELVKWRARMRAERTAAAAGNQAAVTCERSRSDATGGHEQDGPGSGGVDVPAASRADDDDDDDGGGDGAANERLLEANAKMLAFSQITWANQKTRGGPQAAAAVLEHLVSSERVLVDLIEATEAEELFSMKIIAREWEPSVRHDYEFRGFVHGGRLNALSQYNHYCFFPHVLRERNGLESQIREYFDTEIKKRIPLDSYIVDFAVLTDGRVTVVELNPFKTTTGACLFNWPQHREIFENGPFEFRVHERVVPELPQYVEFALPHAFSQAEEDRSLPSLADLQRMYSSQPGDGCSASSTAPRTGCLIM